MDYFVYSRPPLIGPQTLRTDITDEVAITRLSIQSEYARAQGHDESLEDPNTQKLVDSPVLPPLKALRPEVQIQGLLDGRLSLEV